MKTWLVITFIIILILQLMSLALVFALEFERPRRDIDVGQRVENARTNGEVSVGLGIEVDDYDENAHECGGDDVVSLNVSMTANSRKGITYNYLVDWLWWISEGELYHRNVWSNVGDDWYTWVSFPDKDGYPFVFRFYGGRGSAEYEGVYVSSNGFITFHEENATSPTPTSIPDEQKPNALIAGVWTDLYVDNQASIITGLAVDIMCQYYFVIMWKNVLHEPSGKRLTFEIILEDAPQYYPADRRYGQSKIWLSYESVQAINTNYAYGIEDQQGTKGLGGLCSGGNLANLDDVTIEYYQYSNSFFLKKLTLSFQEFESQNTRINILHHELEREVRGYQIQRDGNQPAEPDEKYLFVTALAGTATLLIEAFCSSPPGWIAAGCIIVDTTLVGLDLCEWLAYRQYSGRDVSVYDVDNGHQTHAWITGYTYEYVVDATMCASVHWILEDSNNEDHELKITAKLEYYEYYPDGTSIEKTITTSKTIRINHDDDGKEIAEGIHPWLYIDSLYDTKDEYKILVQRNHKIRVTLTAISPPNLVLDLKLRVHGRWITRPGVGSSETVEATLCWSGEVLIRVDCLHEFGFYELDVEVSPANIPPGGFGGSLGSYTGVYPT